MKPQFVIGWYGNQLALGIEATTPTAESPADQQAANELAREQIELATNRLYNFGAFSGQVHFTHARFAYVITDKERLIKAVQAGIVADAKLAKVLGKPVKKGRHQYAANLFFNSLPRENFLYQSKNPQSWQERQSAVHCALPA